MLRLQTEPVDKTIPASQMNDGDIGVITSWNALDYIGRIVQRYRDLLITVGSPSGNGWERYFRSNDTKPRCRVRLLEKGETLVVE